MTSPMTSPPVVVTKTDGTQIDHIGLACRDLEEGLRYFRDKTGLDPPRANKAPPSVPFQNAYVRIGDATYLEIVGPNPLHKGVHPLKSLLKRFAEPTLWFWFVQTDDFDGLAGAARDAGRRMGRKTEREAEPTMGPDIATAAIGPGFWPVYPSVIHYPKQDMKELFLKDLDVVPMQKFSVVVVGREIDKAKRFFERVGIDGALLQPSDDDKSYLSLSLETPDKGVVTFKSEIESLGIWAALKIFLKDLVGCL